MALKDEITAAEILARIPDNLEPADLTTATVEGYRDQVAEFVEEFAGVTFTSTTQWVKSARLLVINYCSILAVIMAGSDPDVNVNFSPDGELKVSLSAMPREVANFVNATLMLSKLPLSVLTANFGLEPTSNLAELEGDP